MRRFTVWRQDRSLQAPEGEFEPLDFFGEHVLCGVEQVSDPSWDSRRPECRDQVLARVRAFSCNYRDQAWILHALGQPLGQPELVGGQAIGSDFVAEVVDVGTEVQELRVGDRVMPNHSYVGIRHLARAVPQGVVTNTASAEYQVLHPSRLCRVPASMSDECAASFALCSQTAFSMVRKANLHPGDAVLVTAPRSNTSLGVLGALQRRGVELYVMQRDGRNATRWADFGVQGVFELAAPDVGLQLAAFIRQRGGFMAVIDPLFDVFLQHTIGAIHANGTYLTCGLAQQAPQMQVDSGAPLDMTPIVLDALVNNVSIVGNCLGTPDDLRRALQAFEAGSYDLPLDSVHSARPAAFLHRTFFDRERFGKVVYSYCTRP